MTAGDSGERRGGYRRNSGRPVGVRETKPRKPKATTGKAPVIQLPATMPTGDGLPSATRTLAEKLADYADQVTAALLRLIEAPETPADVRLSAIKEFHDRTHGPVPKLVMQHSTGNGGPAPSPRRFEFARSLPVQQDVSDVPVLAAPR
jgi:hypothetical protein